MKYYGKTKRNDNPIPGIISDILHKRKEMHSQPIYAPTVSVADANATTAIAKKRVIVINVNNNKVVTMDGFNNVIDSKLLNESCFKDIKDVVPIMEANVPYVDTALCNSIVSDVIAHFKNWYCEVKDVDSAVELISEMMIYIMRNYPMAMATTVIGEQVIADLQGAVMEKVCNADDDAEESEPATETSEE